MTPDLFATAAAWSYGFALVAYLAFGGRIALGRAGGTRARLLLAATILTATWSAAAIVAAVLPDTRTLLAANIADALRYGAWFLFVANLLHGETVGADLPLLPHGVPRWTVALVVVALAAGAAMTNGLGLIVATDDAGRRSEYILRLGLAVFGLVLIEQLYRRAHPQVRWGVKPLCLALVGVFGFDLFVFADAVLFGRLDLDIWVARGVANALVIPFLAMATARSAGWTVDLHISRGAVFHSTAILVSGLFLLALASAGYFVRYFGGDWGRALQIELVFAGLLFAALVASSGRFRSRLKVFVSKHFFSYRYDYREEWLRFTRTLSTDNGVQKVQERTIMALADLVESPAGVLWLADDDRRYVPVARWNMAPVEGGEAADGPLVTFLARTGWVVSLSEYRADPARHPGLEVPDWLVAVPTGWLIVPLQLGADLLGFVLLGAPRAAVDVNWEVRDLLKTASRQAASYLSQIRATEALLEARKFDAFNRMSAFVVHDLKNLVAQLSLMLKNAERHRDNPEFQRDMLSTVEHVVGRMNGLMLQLRTGTTPIEKPRPIDLDAVVRRVCAAKTVHGVPIALDLAPGVQSNGHEDRLEHVIGHLIQNALDATANGGGVTVRVLREDARAVVEVADSGVGMTPEFIRERLFKPFETTKTAGMGIGVYESAQYLKSLGGELRVDSTVGVGTRIRVLLPLTEPSSLAQPRREVAA